MIKKHGMEFPAPDLLDGNKVVEFLQYKIFQLFMYKKWLEKKYGELDAGAIDFIFPRANAYEEILNHLQNDKCFLPGSDLPLPTDCKLCSGHGYLDSSPSQLCFACGGTGKEYCREQ